MIQMIQTSWEMHELHRCLAPTASDLHQCSRPGWGGYALGRRGSYARAFILCEHVSFQHASACCLLTRWNIRNGNGMGGWDARAPKKWEWLYMPLWSTHTVSLEHLR